MLKKIYKGSSVQEVMERIKSELGEDVFILEQRTNTDGSVEVKVGFDNSSPTKEEGGISSAQENREASEAKVRDNLQQCTNCKLPDRGLILISGDGGTGKSSAAIAMASRLQNEAGATVLYVQLGEKGHDSLLYQAKRLGVPCASILEGPYLAELETLFDSGQWDLILVEVSYGLITDLFSAKEIEILNYKLSEGEVAHFVTVPATWNDKEAVTSMKRHSNAIPGRAFVSFVDLTDDQGRIVSAMIEGQRSLAFFSFFRDGEVNVEPFTTKILQLCIN